MEDNKAEIDNNKELLQHSEKRSSLFIYLLLAFLSVIQIIVIITLVKLNDSIKARNEIILTVPDSLQKQIQAEMSAAVDNAGTRAQKSLESQLAAFEEKYSKLADELSHKITDSISENQVYCNKKMEELVASTDTQFKEIQKKFVTTADEIKKEYADAFSLENNALKSKLAQIESDIQRIINANADKAKAYLDAARKHEEPEIKMMLYATALAYSENKIPVLREYIDWQDKQISDDISRGDLAEAQKKFLAVVTLCNNNMVNGSLADFEDTQGIQSSLSTIDKRLVDVKQKLFDEDKEKVDRLAAIINGIYSYNDAKQLLEEIENTVVPDELEGAKEKMLSDINLKMSYMTETWNEVIVPPVSDETPWLKWGDNFIRRLKNTTDGNYTLARRLEDLGTVSDFLQEAKQSQNSDAKKMMERLEPVIKKVYVDFWKERVDKETSKGDSASLANVSELLNEGMNFSDDIRKTNHEELLRLNQIILKNSIAEIDKNIRHLKNLEDKFNEEIYLQMLSVIQGQLLQLRIRLEGLNEEYPKGFDKQINTVSGYIVSFQDIFTSFKDKQLAKNLEETYQQRQKYVNWVNDQIRNAQDYFEDGEKIAKTWGKTTGSDEAQTKYSWAWYYISPIHPGDLNTVDPALYIVYEQLKMKIEKRRTPTDDELKNVSYKRLSEFK